MTSIPPDIRRALDEHSRAFLRECERLHIDPRDVAPDWLNRLIEAHNESQMRGEIQ